MANNSVENFLGLVYPMTPNPKGFMRTQNGVSTIKSDLLVLLMTNPGEKVMVPEFGTPLRSLAFEPNDAVVVAQANAMIIKAIATWEPRVVIKSINITTSLSDNTNNNIMGPWSPPEENILGITIEFIDPENIKTVQVLTLELPLITPGG